MIKIIHILADAVIPEMVRQHRVFIPLRCPVARRVGERPLRQVVVGRCDMCTEEPSGVAVVVIPQLSLPADANQLSAAVPGVVAVKLKNAEVMAL
ncbi:hypothetical protein [Citrobacter amalonaticus]|uniref:hypothetical protein n=1 Tax=Citrobacter amalonaticus TaxID=35703 RepID=UPI0018C34887|nr:hypothetical protein [Citrobacter amalonaticus]